MYFITGRVPTGKRDRTFYVLDTTDGAVDKMLESDLINLLESGAVSINNAYSYCYILHGYRDISLKDYLPSKGEKEFFTLVGVVVNKDSETIMGYALADYYGKISYCSSKDILGLIGRKRVKNAIHVRHREALEEMHELLQVYYNGVPSVVGITATTYRVNSLFKIDRILCKLMIQTPELDTSNNLCTFKPHIVSKSLYLSTDCKDLKEAILKYNRWLVGVEFTINSKTLKQTPNGVRPTVTLPISDSDGNYYTVVNRIPFLDKGHIPSVALAEKMRFKDGGVFDQDTLVLNAGDLVFSEEGEKLYYSSKEGFMEYDFASHTKACLYPSDYRGSRYLVSGDLVVRIRSWEEGMYDPEGYFDIGVYSLSKREVIGERRSIGSNFIDLVGEVVKMRHTYSTESVFENIYKIIGVDING